MAGLYVDPALTSDESILHKIVVIIIIIFEVFFWK